MNFRNLFHHHSAHATLAAERPLRGVNLGGWLVLEKWMTPSLFTGMNAVDEYSFCAAATADDFARLRRHRDGFITEQDFKWLQQNGIEAVRLPIGYWLFGDEAPYIGTVEYVDRAFQWARQSGIKILLDVHGVPGSQNGQDHSGRKGAVSWHKDQANIIKTLRVISRLAQRYGSEPALLGIELLNEPIWSIPRRILLPYYKAAYRIIRNACGENVWVVFAVNQWLFGWRRALTAPRFQATLMDTHEYQAYAKKDKKLDITGHLHKTLHTVPRRLRAMQRHHAVIVGEWSLALDRQSLQGLNAADKVAAWRAYGDAQLLAFGRSSAWFYWSYKTEADGIWNFRYCIEHGYLPKF